MNALKIDAKSARALIAWRSILLPSPVALPSSVCSQTTQAGLCRANTARLPLCWHLSVIGLVFAVSPIIISRSSAGVRGEAFRDMKAGCHDRQRLDSVQRLLLHICADLLAFDVDVLYLFPVALAYNQVWVFVTLSPS
jgi:hypothetical protein